jgi:AraC-like DNA-binding protein
METRAIQNLLMPVIYVQHLMREFPDPKALFAGTQLQMSDLGRSGSRITVRDNLQCVANAMAMAGDPSWYQEWATRIGEHFHGPLTQAWLSAPTLGDGLDLFVRYFPMRIPYMEFRSCVREDDVALEMQPLIDVGPLLPLLIEVPLLILQQYISTIRNRRMTGAVVELNYEPPAYRPSYRRWFECDVRFQCARNALVTPRVWRDTPNVGYEEFAWRSALQKCVESENREAPRYIVNRLRSELYNAFDRIDRNSRMPTLDGMAATLHMSSRTLIRRLRGMGTTFYKERDELRKIRARELLDAGELSASEIAEVLRFSDSPNFGKAFKRWFGESPSRYRARRAERRIPLEFVDK